MERNLTLSSRWVDCGAQQAGSKVSRLANCVTKTGPDQLQSKLK